MQRSISTVLLVGGLAVILTACAQDGDLLVQNDSDLPVHVDFGDETTEVTPTGGAAMLDYGCSPGDVTIEVDDTSTIVPGPVCPPDSILIRANGSVTLREGDA